MALTFSVIISAEDRKSLLALPTVPTVHVQRLGSSSSLVKH